MCPVADPRNWKNKWNRGGVKARVPNQRRMQYLRDGGGGGAPIPEIGAKTYYSVKVFTEDCMKMKEIGPRGGHASLESPRPPRSANANISLASTNLYNHTEKARFVSLVPH